MPNVSAVEQDAAAILRNSELTRATWKDGVRALFSDGWKELSGRITDAKQIDLLVNNSVEAADAGVMKLADLAVQSVLSEREKAEKTAGKDRREKAAATVLSDIKSALVNENKQIDASTSKALDMVRRIYVDPVDTIKDAALREVVQVVRAKAADVLPELREKLENLSTVNKAILTVVGAAVAGVAGIKSIYKSSGSGFTISLPSAVVKQFPLIGSVGLQELVVSDKGLRNLAASVQQTFDLKGRPLTVAAKYRSALDGASQDPTFSLSGRYKFYEKDDKIEASVRASAERSMGGRDTPVTRASAGLSASRRDAGRFLATEADLTAASSPKKLDLGYRVQVEAGKEIAKNVDLSAYATVQSESFKSRPDVQTGVKTTFKFGAVSWPWANRRTRGNLKMSAALAGRLDGLKRLFKKTGKKLKRKGRRAQAALESAVAPEPHIQLPALPLVQEEKSNVGWWIGGAVAVAAAAGGWWWWKHREG